MNVTVRARLAAAYAEAGAAVLNLAADVRVAPFAGYALGSDRHEEAAELQRVGRELLAQADRLGEGL
jgi:hypothetical protein